MGDRTTISDADWQQPALNHVRAGVALVTEKAADDLQAFRLVLLGLAEAVAGEDGVSSAESEAVARSRAAAGLREPGE
jgi:hypothetical protein